MNKTCSVCVLEKDISQFRFRKKQNVYTTYCRYCENQNNREYKKNNQEKIQAYNEVYMPEYMKQYEVDHKEELKEYRQKYREDNQEQLKEKDRNYYVQNKQQIIDRTRKYADNKRLNDPVFRLRESVSSNIRMCIKKNHQPFAKYLPYTIQDLKTHLEQQFEPWMTWDNYGTYRLDIWNDNDQTTWTWQLDHIVPHSTFQYISMEDQAFRDCWALSNLRPYSAKQNVIDGASRNVLK